MGFLLLQSVIIFLTFCETLQALFSSDDATTLKNIVPIV